MRRLGISLPGGSVRDLPEVFGGRSVGGYGIARYRDNFDRIHAVHFDYEWGGANDGPRRCSQRPRRGHTETLKTQAPTRQAKSPA